MEFRKRFRIYTLSFPSIGIGIVKHIFEGTFKSILDLRAKKIREQREAEAEARRIKRQKQRETEETIKQAMIAGAVIACAFGLLLFVFAAVI